MRRLLCALAFVCLTISGWAQTATISGQINDPATTGQSVNTYLQFELKGCFGNQPRYNGAALLWPVVKKYTASSLGAISGTIYRNDYITCGSSTDSSYWEMTVVQNGAKSPPCNVRIAASTFNANQPTCLNVNPTVTAPTTDSTYAKLDNTNGPFTGNLQAVQFDGVRTVSQSAGATLGARIAACVTALGAAGGTCDGCQRERGSPIARGCSACLPERGLRRGAPAPGPARVRRGAVIPGWHATQAPNGRRPGAGCEPGTDSGSQGPG